VLSLPGRVGATTTTMGIYTQNPTTSMGWFGANLSAGSFLDHYLFTVSAAFSISLQDTLYGGTNGSYGISGLNATIYDSSVIPVAVYGPTAGVLNTTPSGSLAAGSYDLRIDGTAAAGGGSYWGAVTLTTAPIPEPETYAMMLAGLGLMGFVARRRRQK
jgi:hypothetical protein